jgi:DNA processing protein
VSGALPPAAHAAALAGFERMSLHRLSALLRHHSPAEAYAVAIGHAPPVPGGLIAKVLAQPEVREAWDRSRREIDPEQVWERCEELGLEVTYLGHPEHPELLARDPLPPPVLFSAGDRGLLAGRRVALVGTRNATAAGRYVARTFGEGLAAAGVHVVSGLARGIDGHAHAGVMATVRNTPAAAGRPIAVVASGLDIVYPLEHRRLWHEVGEHGLLLSEAPPGAAPLAHMFPQRNRMIAAVSEIVVVVESRERGGSLITASLAAERGVPVMAVPGSAVSRAALGVNALLRDGSPPAVDVDDVLIALSLDHRRSSGDAPPEPRPRPRRDDVGVYRACAERSSTIGELVERTGRPLVEVAMALARLEQAGWLGQVDGWFEPVGRSLP